MSSDSEVAEAMALARGLDGEEGVLSIQVDGAGLTNVEAPDGDCEVEDFVLVYEYPSAADVGLLQEQAAPAEEGSSRQDAKKREEEAKELERIAEAKALQDVAQLESDHETA